MFDTLQEQKVSLSEKIKLISDTSWSKKFQESEFKTLAKYLRLFSINSGDMIFEEGTEERYLGIIIGGEVEISKIDNPTKCLAIFYSSHTLGEMALLDGKPRSARAMARSNVTMLVLTYEKFKECLAKEHQMILKLVLMFSVMMSGRLRTTNQIMMESVYNDKELIRAGNIELNTVKVKVRVGSKDVSLTKSEFLLLHFLIGYPGRVFTRGQIVDAVRGRGHPVTERSVDFHVKELRKKLGASSRHIQTVRGLGFKFSQS